MKITSKLALAALSAAVSMPMNSTQAGDAKMPPPEMVVVADPVFYGSVSVGYESTYLFRGVDFGDNAPWGSVDFGANLAEGITLDGGAWYINPTSGGFDDELDLYAWLSFPLGPLSASVGLTYYYFPEAGGDALEPGVTLAYDIMGMVELAVGYYYDFTAEGSYLETSLSKTIEINDVIGLNLGVGISYGIDYYGVDSWNHVFVTAGPSIALTENATLDIYIGGNFPLEDLAVTEDDDVHGGASITVSF